jgi:hypothetical protein
LLGIFAPMHQAIIGMLVLLASTTAVLLAG